MDVLYLLKNSVHADQEIRYSLRSIERFAPHLGKVWIFGDRPGFLTQDTRVAECVPHDAVARVIDAKTPVRNFFLMLFLASLIPDLPAEFVRFSDDYVLLSDFSDAAARQIRYLREMKGTAWGEGKWMKGMRRSYQLLNHHGMPSYNFEGHVPMYFRKRWIMEAYCHLKDFATPDRYFGLLGNTEILSHAHQTENFELVKLSEEGSRCGFYRAAPTYEDVVQQTQGKTFLNFDDPSFGPGLQRFLAERFPKPSKYEK